MQDSLKEFSGAVIVISHDQHFLNQFAKDIYLVKNAELRRLEGGVAEYVREVMK
jgi:ATP-binding cassette subfamily F protein 3